MNLLYNRETTPGLSKWAQGTRAEAGAFPQGTHPAQPQYCEEGERKAPKITGGGKEQQCDRERNVTTEASSRLLTLGMGKGSPEQSSAAEHLPATHKALGLIPSMRAEWGLEKRATIHGM